MDIRNQVSKSSELWSLAAYMYVIIIGYVFFMLLRKY